MDTALALAETREPRDDRRRIDTSGAAPLLARLWPPERAYCRLAEKLAILELAEQLPGFGPRRVSGPG